jgi:type VI secretion system protein
MALRLRVVSDHRRSLGDRCNIVFGVGGGTIGRSADNDWVLPDPLRYVSAHHARVSFRQGAYFLEDVSTNGVYINDQE